MCVEYVSAPHIIQKRVRRKSTARISSISEDRQGKTSLLGASAVVLLYLHVSELVDLITHASGLRSFNVVTTHGGRQGHIAAAGSRESSDYAYQNCLANDEASGKCYGETSGTLLRLRPISAHDRRATLYRLDGRSGSTANLHLGN